MTKTTRVPERNTPARFLTIDEVADFLQVSTRHVRRLMKTGKLPFHRIGLRAVRISDANLTAYLATTRTGRS